MNWMNKTSRQIWRGFRYSDKYGSHPGTPILIGLIIMGIYAGGWIGGSIMTLIFGSVYVYGAYERGKF